MAILEFDEVYKTFCNENKELLVIDNMNFKVEKGEIIAITGPSGCGKSTILNLISKLEEPTYGKVTVDGEIGYMFQHDHLFNYRNVYQNVILGLEIKKEHKNQNLLNEVNRLINTYGLSEFKNRYPNELSGGMRQRVALIRTLATKPDILLLDEPYSALDYQTRLAVSDDVYNIIKKEKKSVIMVTHDIAEAISMADKVVVLSHRPSEIKEIIEINLTNKTTPINNRKAKEFSTYYEKIWKAIDYHV